jgi:para-aminobenzoate synthetase/4-amino-4-deoxychorismate lyase
METPLSSAVDSPEQKIVLAKHPMRTDTPFVYHKTTRREMYESALEDAGDADDVLLWNDDGYITETSIANVIVSIDGQRYTPPVECGLLAGTYRAGIRTDADQFGKRRVFCAAARRFRNARR